MPVREWVAGSRGSRIEYDREFEQREAARFGRYTWREFTLLTSWEKEGLIAHYRTRQNIDAAVSEKARRDTVAKR